MGFLAWRDEFAKLIEAGHTLRSIYTDHQDGIGIGYTQFTRYVTHYIRTGEEGTDTASEERNAPHNFCHVRCWWLVRRP